jgi:acyl carrier protein
LPRESLVPSAPRPTTPPDGARRADLERRLIHCFAAVFGDLRHEEIPGASVSSLAEWDSMASMTLLALIEEEFRLRIPIAEIAGLTSFSEILDYLGDQTARSGGDSGSLLEGPGRDRTR